MDQSHTSPESWATVTPADLVRSISRRLPSVLVTTLLVMLLIGGLLLAWPNQYASDGLFYARLGRGAVSMDPTTEPTRSVSLQESRSSEVNSISQMLTSREIMDRVVRKVGAREINHPRNWIEKVGNLVSSNEAKEATQQSESNNDRIETAQQLAHEVAVKKVAKAVTVTVPKDSYTISVLAKGSDPMLVQEIVQAILDEYGAYHVEAHRSNGSLDFFEQQSKDSRGAALASHEALQQARQDMGWMSAESAEKAIQERMVELEIALDKAESDLADSESRTKVLKQRLAGIKEWIPMETMQVANEAADLMRSQLYESQLNDGEKLAKVTTSHPRYKLLREKMSSGAEIVDSVGSERQQSTEAINPIRVKLETDYEVAMAKTAGLRSRRDSVSRSLAAAKQDAKRLTKDAVVLNELAWKAEIAENIYLDHSESLESTRLMHELDMQEMSDVSVIQNASLNLKKVGPPRAILFGLGGLLGLCVGVLQALVRDNPVGSKVSSNRDSSGRRKSDKIVVPMEAADEADSYSTADGLTHVSSDQEEEERSWVKVPR
ncbi:Chain length determinant protein [Rubripirellula obstinata]|uniref:Chain length determinant protein n=1 Tax=Rubripirellula obstinata TaxID=406547 RepID=A0A5B1CJL3_9BACT|nr:hypothetical protein [Rubripirellula obstinata]KAA1259710.1 Chain length determinant protein [Rubripirellula obstinata]